MNILLTGGSGQLGQELQKLRTYIAPSHQEMDITDPDSILRYIGKQQIDLIVHSAAYTQTLKPDNDPEAAAECFKVNVLGTRNLVTQAACPIIFISTESAVEPYNFYILTKMQAEYEVKLHKYGSHSIRTSFRYDPFEYPKAATDMLTIGDTVAKIAPLIDAAIEKLPMDGGISYIGTGVKTVFELAKETRPDVIGLPRAEIFARLPAMEGLRNVL
jgi:dTDP-4-dehydrorhamnose reductase